MCPFELVATPVTSPRYSLSGSFRKFGTESNGISGTASCAPPNCCCAEIARPATRTTSATSDMVSMRFMVVPPLPRRRSAGGLRRSLLRMQDDLLRAPRGDLRYPQLVFVAAVHSVNRAEFLQLFPGLAELADDGAVELHLVDLAGDVTRRGGVAVGIGVRRVEILVWTRRDA